MGIIIISGFRVIAKGSVSQQRSSLGGIVIDIYNFFFHGKVG